MRTGIWLVGGRGSVATTTIVGAAAVRAGVVPPTGCVAELPIFHQLPLSTFDDLMFGGHDVTDVALTKRAELLTEAGVLPAGLADLAHDALLAAEAELRPGTDVSTNDAETCGRLAADLTDFRSRNDLDQVVVVDVSATEAKATPDPAHESWQALRAAMGRGSVLPASSRYACAAFLAGCGFVGFTPSTGARLPALDELARSGGVCYAGCDGKTGETLVKAALAPMFAHRALRVHSWSGTNLLGGGDGANLADPDRAASKAESKALVLERTLGHPVEGGVHIHNVPGLGDWKTAWDHISFSGFLGVRMTMQFTWQGCDSALAAPLVLDLVRFLALAQHSGRSGAVPELACYFKDPIGTGEHGFDRQFATLVDWASGLR
jgi:myo-inositol-1-phosphate synthase